MLKIMFPSLVTALSLIIAMPLATAAQDASPSDGVMGLPPGSQPSSLNDRFVGGHFDPSGAYVAPHYQPHDKPAFHGYFDQPTVDPLKGKYHDPMKLETPPASPDDSAP